MMQTAASQRRGLAGLLAVACLTASVCAQSSLPLPGIPTGIPSGIPAGVSAGVSAGLAVGGAMTPGLPGLPGLPPLPPPGPGITTASTPLAAPPGVRSSGSGLAQLYVDETTNTATVSWMVMDTQNIILAHIHFFYGARNELGPPIVPLLPGPPLPAVPLRPPLSVHGQLTAAPYVFNATAISVAGLPPDVATQLKSTAGLAGFLGLLRAGLLYFNVHTVAHPNGELRGQLSV